MRTRDKLDDALEKLHTATDEYGAQIGWLKEENARLRDALRAVREQLACPYTQRMALNDIEDIVDKALEEAQG